MVDTLSPLSPASYLARGKATAEEKSLLPSVVNERIQECLAEAGGWISEARLAQRYYRSDQYRKYSNAQDRYRIRLVANFIRRDIDLMVAQLLDGEPVVNPSGRNPKHFELGRLLLSVLSWTRDEEDDWEQDLEAAIVDCVHIGEGVIFEGWDQDADKGNGLPVAKRLDSRYVFWDYSSTNAQRDDADYIIWLEYVAVDKVEDMWPHMRGQIQPETAENFLTPHQQQYYRANLGASSYVPLLGLQHGTSKKCWIRRMWSKKHLFKKEYWDRETWNPAMVFDPASDDEIRMTQEHYVALSPEEKEGIYDARTPYEELWETIVVSHTLIEHRLSPFDKENGGHGRYPFAFFSCNILADESHARGEIGFLIQVQDITNEAISQYLNQLFLSNVGFLHAYKGSVPPEEQDKLGQIGRDPLMLIETNHGMPPPSFQGVNPTGMQAAAGAIPLIKDVIMDNISGVHGVDRGQAESGIQSGRAIRALQAKTSLLSNKLVRHIESGLKRSTLMRLHNIMQFMRGNRVLQVADPDEGREDEKTLIIGHDEVEIVAYHKLIVEEDGEGGVRFLFPDGSEAEILVLNEEVAENVAYEQIRLKLDTGQEKNKLEKQDDARMVLQAVGAPAMAWVARQLEWSDPELLLNEIKKADTGAQIMEQLSDASKMSGMSIEEIMQQMMDQIQQQVMMQEAQDAAGPEAPLPPGVPGMAPPGPPTPDMPPDMPPGAVPGMTPPGPPPPTGPQGSGRPMPGNPPGGEDAALPTAALPPQQMRGPAVPA